MLQISDETLMSYADGELSGADRQQVEAYVAASSDGARRLEIFTATRATLAELFNEPLREPVPQHLIDAVMGRATNSETSASNVISFKRRPTGSTPLQLPKWALAAACASLLVVGAGAKWFLPYTQGSVTGSDTALIESGTNVAAANLVRVLETVTSGDVASLAVNGAVGTFKPVFTFATAKKEFCRQYDVTGAENLTGVACREASGKWRVEMHTPNVAAASQPNERITPAGKDMAIDVVVDRLISGDVLSVEDEARVIKNEWNGK